MTKRKFRLRHATEAPVLPLKTALANSDPAVHKALAYAQRLKETGRIPLIIAGSGVSIGSVPTLDKIVDWLHNRLITFRSELQNYDWLLGHAEKLQDPSRGTRRQAAEFFSVLQDMSENRLPPVLQELWKDFSFAFVHGKARGSDDTAWSSGFPGTAKALPRAGHRAMATMITHRAAHVVSLNFDGLTIRALRDAQSINQALVLHTKQQVTQYFTAMCSTFVPAVFKIRGDVFYAACELTACPLSIEPYPLEQLNPEDTGMHCPYCRGNTLRLHFSFPGYREKEEYAYEMLWELRRYLARCISCVIIVGLSGMWDRYLLRFLFDMSVERCIPVFDVKPEDKTSLVIDGFRASYYPSVRSFENHDFDLKPSFLRVVATSDSFLTDLASALCG